MTRRAVGAGVLREAVAVVIAAGVCVAQETPLGSTRPFERAVAAVRHSDSPRARRSANFASSIAQDDGTYPGRAPRVELFQHSGNTPQAMPRRVERARQRFRIELQRARAQAEDWLHDAGFSLLEERDSEGKRTYALLSGTLVADGPVIRFHARVGRPQLSAGLTVRRNRPAFGFTIPWQQYTVEMEALEDQELGYMLMGRFRWSDPQRRLQYGLAFPLSFEDGGSIGVVLQVHVRFGK